MNTESIARDRIIEATSEGNARLMLAALADLGSDIVVREVMSHLRAVAGDPSIQGGYIEGQLLELFDHIEKREADEHELLLQAQWADSEPQYPDAA